MYAIVRRYAYDPAAIASAGQALAAAQELHTTQGPSLLSGCSGRAELAVIARGQLTWPGGGF
jgi:hypothetical protein